LKHGILVVEDNQPTASSSATGSNWKATKSGSAADLKASYEAFAERLPDAVLLDINLGGENGLDLVAWMRQKPELWEIPVIAVTAHALVTEQLGILQAGCRACLSKPINFQGLRNS